VFDSEAERAILIARVDGMVLEKRAMRAGYFICAALLYPIHAEALEKIEKVIIWKKPEIYITHREPCLEYSLAKKTMLVEADLIEDLGESIKVKCKMIR
jgi:hypothetical protein